MGNIRYIGLDVHAASVAVAVADHGASGVTFVGKFPNEPRTILKVFKKLGANETLRVAYEAGPTGYGLYRDLVGRGIECHVVAPTLVPVKSGDKVKTDRRDAEKLARALRSGDLSDVWVPTVETEGLRDLVRGREDAKEDQLRARHRLSKFLLRHGLRKAEGKAWTVKYMAWVRQQRFENACQQAAFEDYISEVEHADARVTGLDNKIAGCIPDLPLSMQALIQGLQSMRGVATVTSVTLASEIGSFSRFENPKQLMAYAGVVPSEYSSGGSTRRGAITKTGNSHVRRVVVESAWNARFKPALSYGLKRRQSDDPKVREIAWRAQQRLHTRYNALKGRGKTHNKVLIAVARELLGFAWEIGCTIERQTNQTSAQA